MKNLGVSEIIVIFAPVLFDEQQSRMIFDILPLKIQRHFLIKEYKKDEGYLLVPLQGYELGSYNHNNNMKPI